MQQALEISYHRQTYLLRWRFTQFSEKSFKKTPLYSAVQILLKIFAVKKFGSPAKI